MSKNNVAQLERDVSNNIGKIAILNLALHDIRALVIGMTITHDRTYYDLAIPEYSIALLGCNDRISPVQVYTCTDPFFSDSDGYLWRKLLNVDGAYIDNIQ